MPEISNKNQRNTLLAVFFVGILAVMLVPLPPLLLVVAGGVPHGVEEDEEEEAAPMP